MFNRETTPPISDPDLKKRSIAGRIAINPIQKRGSSSNLRTLGGCTIITQPGLPFTRPAYPFPFTDMLQAERAGNMDPKFSVISRYDLATRAGCVFTTTKLNANRFANAPDWENVNGDIKPENKRLSLDHACKIPPIMMLTFGPWN
jgi:hypothetical protein